VFFITLISVLYFHYLCFPYPCWVFYRSAPCTRAVAGRGMRGEGNLLSTQNPFPTSHQTSCKFYSFIINSFSIKLPSSGLKLSWEERQTANLSVESSKPSQATLLWWFHHEMILLAPYFWLKKGSCWLLSWGCNMSIPGKMWVTYSMLKRWFKQPTQQKCANCYFLAIHNWVNLLCKPCIVGYIYWKSCNS